MTPQGTNDDMNSPQPSGAVAGPPAATVAAAAGGVMTVGSITTVTGIIMIFMAIAAVFVYLQFYFDAWNRRDQSRHGSQASSRRRRSSSAAVGIRADRGVDPDVLRSLPVTVYRAAAAAGSKDSVECAVCLADLEDGEAARFLPRCGHGFHAECVDTWLASHTTCPLCRLAVVAKPDASPAPASLALRPVPLEPASYYAANVPASVLLGVALSTAATMASEDGDMSASAGTMGVLVIEIPEVAAPTPLLTPRDAAKSPGSARARSFRRLWSFGRQGAGPSSSSSCGDAGEGGDVEQGVSVTIGLVLAEEQLPSSEAAAGAIQDLLCSDRTGQCGGPTDGRAISSQFS